MNCRNSLRHIVGELRNVGHQEAAHSLGFFSARLSIKMSDGCWCIDTAGMLRLVV